VLEHDALDIIKILVAASELNLQELISYLQSFLIENKTKWMEQNFNLIYQMSFENDSFLGLQSFCAELISEQPEKVFNSPNFTSISEKALISLIKHDNHQMSEVKIWEHVLKWGIAQSPQLSSDPSNYSNDDFDALKNTLQQCIPFIKFLEFTSKDFSNKVLPYKKIIPEKLYDDSIKYFLDNPNSRPKPRVIKRIGSKNIDSKIVTIQHAELISKWIDRLEITDELKNLYEFKLILRGSRDGFTPEEFHKICDNKSQTITIIKVKGSNEILGGYNPIVWKNCFFGKKGATKDSFIFSFKNDDSTEDYIISRVKDEKYAIYNDLVHGPSFGYSDLMIMKDVMSENYFARCYCKKYSYEKSIRETGDFYFIEEYEVFQITKDI
jgi:hypothetical protein